MAYVNSQDTGQIGAIAAGLYHSNTGYEPHMQHTLKLMVMPDP